MSVYHEGARDLQDRFDTRRLADQLAERFWRTAFTPEDKAFIESRAMFFLATADEHGRPECSYKGGLPGFVRVTAADELSFPSYDGNGMFRSLGNIGVNANVGLLFLDFEQPRRLRGVRGRAAHRPREGRGDLPELSALHPPSPARRDLGLCAAPGLRAAGAGLEEAVPRRAAREARQRLTATPQILQA